VAPCAQSSYWIHSEYNGIQAASAASRPYLHRRAAPPEGGRRAGGKKIYIININYYIYYGARARASGTCLVAVLHAASAIGYWGRAAGAASVIVCW